VQFTHRFDCENREGDQLEEVEIYVDNIKVGIKEVGWEGVDNSSGSHREKWLL
jgi:hypothetical protein